MKIWALSDPHLAFGAPEKTMEVFGPEWESYPDRIEKNWKERVGEGDLVLLPGDISWAMRLDDALIDLNWIDALPGAKVILRGNHDYWWPSSKKLEAALPPSITFIHNSALQIGELSLGGSRLWDTQEYGFEDVTVFKENPRAKKIPPEDLAKKAEEDERIFQRELDRLEMSLKQMKPGKIKIALTHYPPIGADLKPSRASKILEDHGIDVCVFGHLHNIKKGALPFGEARGVKYIFASCDYLDFCPIEIPY